MASVHILGGSFPTQTAYIFSGRMTVERADQGSSTYLLQHAVVSVRKISETKKKVLFEFDLRDGRTVRAEASYNFFHQVNKYVRPDTGTAYIVEEKSPSDALKSKKNGERIVWLVVGLLTALAVYSCTNEEGPKPNKPAREANINDAKIMAPILCKDRVKETLKSPRSAKFPFVTDVTFDGSTAVLSSYVDAQSSFGGLIRTQYICMVEYTGDKPGDFESWHIKNFSVFE